MWVALASECRSTTRKPGHLGPKPVRLCMGNKLLIVWEIIKMLIV
jgi:hypothetical protein